MTWVLTWAWFIGLSAISWQVDWGFDSLRCFRCLSDSLRCISGNWLGNSALQQTSPSPPSWAEESLREWMVFLRPRLRCHLCFIGQSKSHSQSKFKGCGNSPNLRDFGKSFKDICRKFSSVQLTQSCPTLCDPMNCSTPGFPVHHQLPEFIQTHVHRVGDAIHPSHPLSFPSPPALNPSQHRSLFQWVNSSHEVAKVLEFQL